MRKGVAWCLWLLSIGVLAERSVEKTCDESAKALEDVFYQSTAHAAKSGDMDALLREIGDALGDLKRLLECSDLQVIREIDLKRGCEPHESASIALNPALIQSAQEAIESFLHTSASGREALIASLDNVPAPVSDSHHVGCFADCENDFLLLFTDVKTLLIDSTAGVDKVISDLIMLTLQIGVLVQHCLEFI